MSQAPIHAIILAAGRGQRMQPLTNQCHKTLLPIARTTILGRIVDSLLSHRVTDITIVTGHRAADIRTFLDEQYPGQSFSLVHNDRWAQTNNITSLAMALQQLSITHDVLLIESDLIYDPALLGRLLALGSKNVALVDVHQPGMDGTVVSVSDGFISQVYPPHLQGEGFDYSDKFKTLNIYRFTREFCTKTFAKLLSWYASTIDDSCYYELVLGMLIFMQNERIYAEDISGMRWAEVDDPNDFDVARFVFNQDDRRQLLDAAFGGFWSYDLVDFAFIRNMHFPNGAMLSALRRSLPALLHNYGSKQTILNRKLGYHTLLPSEDLQLLNGASQGFMLLRERLGQRRVLIPAPTFGEFSRCFPNHFTYADTVGIDREEIVSLAQEAEVVVFVNPNNPTGTTLPTEWLHRFSADHPHKTVIVDESFVDFSGEEPLTHRLQRHPLHNVIVLKSLSKTLGVPGLRLGFVYAQDQELQRWMAARIPIWNTNAPAEFFLELTLKFRNALARSFTQTAEDRTALSGELAALDAVEAVYPSGANFLLVRLRGDHRLASQLVDALLSNDSIYLKDVSQRFPGAPAMLRIAVRLPEDNTRLVSRIAHHLKAAPQ